MSTSAVNGRRSCRRASAAYLAVSAFCGIFAAVYEHFSHGVYSGYMVYLFLFPLIGGVIPFFAILLSNLPSPKRLAFNLYNSGVAALTVGSAFIGVLEIYGTTSELAGVYFIAGTVFILSGIASYIFSVIRRAAKARQHM